MKHFSTIEPQLFYSFPICEEEKEKIDRFLSLLEESGVYKLLADDEEQNKTGRPEYNRSDLFAAILLSFAIGKPSLREIESSCRNDLRFIYILKGVIPDHSTIARFVTEVIMPQKNRIFACVTEAIFKALRCSSDICYIDGTKLEANANKYKFVWKPTTLHLRLCDKVRTLLTLLGLEKDVPAEGIFGSDIIREKLTAAEKLTPESFGITEKALNTMKTNLMDYFFKALEYEEKETICGPHRKSYYKTDHGATAMCLKKDYYSGLGSNMHAAYSVQLIVSNGIIASIYVSQDRADMHTFVSAIEVFREMYGKLPKSICTDAGYGCVENYRYCDENGIDAYVKYSAWEGENNGRRPATYELNEDGTITCIGGRKGISITIENRHPKQKGGVFYKVEHCEGCPFMLYCRQFMNQKEGSEKVFEVPVEYIRFKQKARDMLLTPKGIEMRVNRSCQVEGAFGAIKQNMAYTRFRRTTMERASNEMMLVSLGYNIRKFMHYSAIGTPPKYWTAPENMAPGQFKKPSAKRIVKRIEKRLQRQSGN